MVFGTVHSARTVVVLLHKHCSSWLSIFCNSISIITNCTYANVSKSNIMTYVNNLFPFFRSAYYVQFPLSTAWLLPFFHLDCTRWCGSMFLTHFGNKSLAVEKGVTSTTLHHQCNQFTHVTDGMTVTSLSASLQHKTSAARDCLCQIT
jgi:hypothetical protein